MPTDKKTKKQLWLSLHAYHFDHLVPPQLIDYVTQSFGGADAFTKAFASKLSRKLEWKRAFALRAIAEYKKFVFLGLTSPQPLTPSKVIDQVWHEHQLFTKAYRDFCREIICQDFDHNPELIPLEPQTLIFSEQYLDTLDRYRSEFNLEPPADIWAVPKFNSSLVAARSARKSTIQSSESRVGDDGPIYLQFDSTTSGSSRAEGGFEGFDGGDSGGGGASSSWDADHAHSHHGHSFDSGSHSHSHSDSSSHSGGSDSGSASSSCSSSSCSSGSSCGSSCGGGGCSSS
jgi:hypothetical protein